MIKRIVHILGSKKTISILIIIAIAVFFITRRGRGDSANIKSTRVSKGEVISELVLSGVVEARSVASLTYPASSNVTSLLVEEGDSVEKGQVLGSIDTTTLSAAVRQAESNHRNAQATVDRVYDQLKGKEKTESYSEIETRTTAEVARDVAYENVVKARKALRDATFISPINGIVSQIGVKTIGGSTTIGAAAFVIVDPSTLYFSVKADQTEVGQIDEGEKVILTLDAFDEKTVEGNVYSVSLTPKIGEAETVYETKVSINNTKDIVDNVLVGMTGDAKFELEKKQDVMFVDSLFVKTDKDGRYVLKGESREKKYVKTGLEGEERIELLEGVSLGDELFNQ